jgi:cell wall-associated NlpC family hydrolase
MALLLTRSERSRGNARYALRRAGGVLVCSLALSLLPLCASASADSGAHGGSPLDRDGFGMLGHTVLTALATTTNADDAIDALGDSLALMEARSKIAASAEAEAREPQPAPAAQPEPAASSNPTSLAPASAGSNGTTDPNAASASGDKIFAHARASSAPGVSNAILLTGIALAPPDAPEAVKGVINNANAIVGRPYVWGGGHASFYSYGYDCSGAVSFALFGGGLIPEPLTSTGLESWGAPGPGKWITIYANAEHTFAEIAGLRWDTVGDAQGTGPRWHLAPNSHAGFVVRHPPGL